MSNVDTDLEDRERRLDEAAANYFELRSREVPFDREKWLGQYPDLAAELADFLNDLEQFKPAADAAETFAAEPSLQNVDTLFPGRGDSPVRLDATVHQSLKSSAPTQRYRLRQFLARGGMGEVWLADDVHVGRSIALKKIRDPHQGGRMMEERFLVESQIMGQLEHPCIVPLHDLGRDESGELYAAMKLVQGSSLKLRLNEFHANKADDWPRRVDFQRLLEAFVSICRAVAYSHSRKVLHRDIKPDNIMLGNYGESLLLDWGLAKIIEPERSDTAGRADATDSFKLHNSLPPAATAIQVKTSGSTATQAGAIMGSPAYMAPEIALGHSEGADERTDVYLLGATLYEMLTGKQPRTGSSRLELIELAQHTPPTSPRRIDTRIPKALEAICLRAMAHERGLRYGSAADLADEMEKYLASEPISAYQESLVIRCWRWCRRHQRSIQRVIVGALLVLLTMLVLMTYRHSQDLENRELGRQQLAVFRRVADESQFFAANVDSVNEHAPYFDAQRAIQTGNVALTLASLWDDDASQFPIASERSAIISDRVNLLLLLANLHQQSDVTIEGQTKALELLDQATVIRPVSQAAYKIRKRCLEQLGSAVVDSNANISSNAATPTTTQDFFMEGEFSRANGQLTAASVSYQQAVRLDPRHYWAHYQLARCYLGLQRGPEAITALGTCIALRPESPWAYSTRGLIWGLLGDFDSADTDLSEALSLAPQFRPARLNRGMVYYLQNRSAEALSELDAVLQPPEASSLIEAAFYRAQIYYQRGDLKNSLRDCEMFLEQRPKVAAAHTLLAQNYFRLGDDARGLQCVNAALACGAGTALSSNPKIARGRALRELAMGMDLASQQRILVLAMKEFAQAGDGNSEAAQEMTAVKDLLGFAEEAVVAYTERLTAVPGDRVTRKKRGWNYVTLRRLDLAATDFETVIQQDPEDSEAYSGIGYVHALQGEVAAAELAATQAVIYGANGFLVLHNVACIYAELAETNQQQRTHYDDLAIAMLQRAVFLAKQSRSGFDEIEQIRVETAFHPSLRSRPEFERLIGSAATVR